MRVLALAWVASCLALLSGCGDDDDPAASTGCTDTSVDTTGCTVALNPDAGATGVQRALIEAQSGADVCFCPGTFAFDKEISLTVPDVTMRGLGATRADTVLDFGPQTIGDDGVTVTSDGFTIENLTIKNTPGNGIVVTGAEDVTFRNLSVSWDAGSVVENGAYAVYPVKSRRVIVEDSEVVGAADAGIYVGQCEEAIVRNNVVHGNVAGIEIENSTGADVYGNEAYDNTAGILVFVLPNLEKQEGARTKVHDNVARENNRPNFAEEGTIVASVPTGVGMLLLAADETEIANNTIEDNISTALFIVSFSTLSLLIPDVMLDDTDPDPEKTYIHGNTFSGNGTDPQGAASFIEITPLEDVVWDGVEKGTMKNASAELCFGSDAPSFRDFGGVEGIGDETLHSTDTGPHECTLDELPELSW
jgi:parallel beta-helix repeat protein